VSYLLLVYGDWTAVDNRDGVVDRMESANQLSNTAADEEEEEDDDDDDDGRDGDGDGDDAANEQLMSQPPRQDAFCQTTSDMASWLSNNVWALSLSVRSNQIEMIERDVEFVICVREIWPICNMYAFFLHKDRL